MYLILSTLTYANEVMQQFTFLKIWWHGIAYGLVLGQELWDPY